MNQTYLFWIVFSGLLLVGEMLSGTFYLLVISIAFASAGLLAWLGVSFAWQMLAAAGIGLIGTSWLWQRRRSQPAAENQGVLDIGQVVSVISWHDAERARVRHRGAEWDARLIAGSAQSTTFYIAGIQASTLLLSDHPPEK